MTNHPADSEQSPASPQGTYITAPTLFGFAKNAYRRTQAATDERSTGQAVNALIVPIFGFPLGKHRLYIDMMRRLRPLLIKLSTSLYLISCGPYYVSYCRCQRRIQ